MSISLIILLCYLMSGLLILELWKSYAHLFCDEDDDPHSLLAYVVVVIAGPLVAIITALQDLAEYLIGRRDDR
jgi:hypothetical protein